MERKRAQQEEQEKLEKEQQQKEEMLQKKRRKLEQEDAYAELYPGDLTNPFIGHNSNCIVHPQVAWG